MSQKNQIRKILNYTKSSCMIFWAKMTRNSRRCLNYIKSSRIIFWTEMFPYFQIVLFWCILLCKIGSIFFSSFFRHPKFHHFLECHTTNIDSSFNSFLSALYFSNLICQAKSLTILFIYTRNVQAQNFLMN